MIGITVICVGKLKEAFYADAVKEYEKRLGAYCRLRILELPEAKLPGAPTQAQIDAGLEREAGEIEKHIPAGCALIVLCVEGQELDSPALAEKIRACGLAGTSRLCFVIGSSYGLHPRIKKAAGLRLSMSKMTFPHHLARVMLLEQIYRAFKIQEGSRYHK